MKAAVVQTIQAAACMGSSGQAWTAGGESDPGERTDKDGDDVDAAEDAVEFKVTFADPRGEIDGADQESEASGEYVGDEETAVGDDRKTVGGNGGVIGDEKYL